MNKHNEPWDFSLLKEDILRLGKTALYLQIEPNEKSTFMLHAAWFTSVMEQLERSIFCPNCELLQLDKGVYSCKYEKDGLWCGECQEDEWWYEDKEAKHKYEREKKKQSVKKEKETQL